jgi:hypothetical protein
VCPLCRSNSRKRHVAQQLIREVRTGCPSLRHLSRRPVGRDIFSAVSHDPIWRYLHADPNFYSSEYVDGVALGTLLGPRVTCQDLESLTFKTDSLGIE